MKSVCLLLALLLAQITLSQAFIRLWNRCPEGSSTRRWDILRQRCTPDCPAFHVYNTWFRRCERGGPDSCQRTEYWDLALGKCVVDPCQQGWRLFGRGDYFDQQTRTCRQAPYCGFNKYYEDETGHCKRCGVNERVGQGLYCIHDPPNHDHLD